VNAKRIYQETFDDDSISVLLTDYGKYLKTPLSDYGRASYSFQILDKKPIPFQQFPTSYRKSDVLSHSLSSAISESNLMEYVSIIIYAIKAKDITTYEHSWRVAEYADKIASALNVKTLDRKKVKLTALMHDAGKLGIDDAILVNPSILDDEEWNEMKKHPSIGANIVGMLPKLIPISRYIRFHHERYDGNGYPDKLHKKNIPLVSRIISVADAYDAMTHKRPYRAPLSKKQALAELEKQKGKQFDPYIVRVFATLLRYGHCRKAKNISPLMGRGK